MAALLAASCTPAPEPPQPDLTAAHTALLGRWTDLTTNSEAPAGENGWGPLAVIVFAASNQCADTTNTLMMKTAWPLGTTADPPYNMPSFLRDTTDATIGTLGTSEFNISLPASAPAPRFAREGNTIRVDHHARWIYLERADGRVERWARLRSNVGECA